MINTIIRIAAIIILAVIGGIVARPHLETQLFTASISRNVGPLDIVAELERSTIQLFERASPSVVQITTLTTGNDSAPSELRTGSGFFWDVFGNIVTNEHVVNDAKAIIVWLASGEHVAAEIVGSAQNYDLAVIRAKEQGQAPIPISIGTSSNLKIGQWAYAIGSPFGLDQSLTTGVISALKRRLPTSKGRAITNMIQTDAAIYPGNSGGPLLDSKGRLIGVNTIGYSVTGSNNALGFAIPVDIVSDIVPKLIAKGRVPTPGIGIVPGDGAALIRMGLEGVIIARIRPGSPAERAALRATNQDGGVVGDVITAANGERIRDVFDLTSQLEHIGVGHTVKLQINRDGKTLEMEVEVIDIDLKSQP